MCDGAISNVSETIMNQYGVGQDEFIFRMYSIALVAITVAATVKGDLREGMLFLSQPGTYNQLSLPLEERTWSVPSKIAVIVLFSTMGFFGSSCSAAITKNFGALTMSITSTARKATTLFLSFAFFDNECTMEHISGVFLFISALVFKSLNRGRNKSDAKKSTPLKSSPLVGAPMSGASDLDLFNSPNRGRTLVASDMDLTVGYTSTPSRIRKQVTAPISGASDMEFAVHTGTTNPSGYHVV
jgi:hypothetical protein